MLLYLSFALWQSSFHHSVCDFLRQLVHHLLGQRFAFCPQTDLTVYDLSLIHILNGETSMFELLTDTDLSSLGEDDIVISTYLFDSLAFYGLKDATTASNITLTNYQDAVGKVINLPDNMSFTIKGVFRSDLPAKYDSLKDKNTEMCIRDRYNVNYAQSGDVSTAQETTASYYSMLLPFLILTFLYSACMGRCV